MLQKLFKMTQDRHLTSLIAELMSNRRFFVQMGPRKSKWKVAKNGLPQGGVLAPLLFNVYTNDQPLSTDTRSFIYADDRATLAQGKNKREVEEKLMKCLSELSDYYHANRLKANPGKTVSCMFHLNNRQAAHALELQWNSVKIEHDAGPKYLGVTLDRMLSFKQHCENFAGKIQSRNNLLSKLANSRWGANPHVMRTTALAMCYSVAEYACPVWLDSTHSKLIDVALNETCRKITGCMKSTPINQLYNQPQRDSPALDSEEMPSDDRETETGDWPTTPTARRASIEPKTQVKIQLSEQRICSPIATWEIQRTFLASPKQK